MSGKKPRSSSGSLNDLVTQYLLDHGPKLDAYLKFFAKPTLLLSDAIERSGLTIDGKVHDHQRLVGRKKLEQVSKALLKNIDTLKACRSFEELHQLVSDCTRHIDRFGVLARYDISLRIGANLGLRPEIVHLHAGSKKGCKKLGVQIKGKTVEMSSLPKPIQRLKPHHAENFLCIYKDGFGTHYDSDHSSMMQRVSC
jgi:hypothetical protein